MRLSQIFLVLPFVVAAPAAGDHISASRAPYELCMGIPLAPGTTRDKAALCECATKAFQDKALGMDIFLKNYMHFYETTGGDRDKSEGLMVQEYNLDYNDVTGLVGLAIAEMSSIMSSGVCK